MLEIDNSKRVHFDDNDGVVSKQQTIPMDAADDTRITTDHPLNNELVLGIIFDHLSKNHWKSARLVNKTWYSTLQSKWRGQMVYKLGLAEDYPLNETLAKWNSPLLRFLKQQHPVNNPNDPLQLGRHPIRNVSVGWSQNDNHVRLRSNQFQFWEFCGHGLKSLHLDRVRITKCALLKRLVFELTPNLEEFQYYQCICNDINKRNLNAVISYSPPATVQRNLKYLILNTTSEKYPFDSFKRRFPINWIEFFSVFPNIQKLQVENDPKPSNLLKLFKAIDIVRKANNNEVLNITEINTPGKTGLARANVVKHILLFSSLPISTLHMNITQMNNEETTLLIQTYKSNLRDLTLWKPDNDLDEYLPIDVLPQGLTKLGLFGPLFDSFEFLLCTPNLEELILDDITSMYPYGICRLTNVVPKLQRFTFTHCRFSERIKEIAKLMPNLKTCICTVNVHEDEFRAVCQGWPNLEHLDLDYYSDFYFVTLIQLKGLKSLKIKFASTYCLSDKLVFEGFLKMPFLTRVQLPSRGKITDDGLKALEAKLCVDFDAY